MKRSYLLLNFKQLVRTVLIVAFLLSSCQKDSTVMPKPETIPAEVNQAQQWFNGEVLQSPPDGTRTVEGMERLSGKYNYWKHGKVYKLGNDRIVEVPFGEEVRKSYLLGKGSSDAAAKSTLRRLVLTLHGNGQTDYALMTIVASPGYLEKGGQLNRNHYRDMDEGFTGMVLYHSWDERFIGGWRYADGKIIGEISGMVDDADGGDRQMELVDMNCTYKPVYQYCTVCAGPHVPPGSEEVDEEKLECTTTLRDETGLRVSGGWGRQRRRWLLGRWRR